MKTRPMHATPSGDGIESRHRLGAGHYWCNQCDDPAFGERCQTCGRESTWIPTPPPTAIESSVTLVVPDALAKTLFNKIRETIQQA